MEIRVNPSSNAWGTVIELDLIGTPLENVRPPYGCGSTKSVEGRGPTLEAASADLLTNLGRVAFSAIKESESFFRIGTFSWALTQMQLGKRVWLPVTDTRKETVTYWMKDGVLLNTEDGTIVSLPVEHLQATDWRCFS